jgi:hypothetical protein
LSTHLHLGLPNGLLPQDLYYDFYYIFTHSSEEVPVYVYETE